LGGFLAIDNERWLPIAQIAKGHHGLGEARRNLANRFHHSSRLDLDKGR
jgi:hypothetical protein